MKKKIVKTPLQVTLNIIKVTAARFANGESLKWVTGMFKFHIPTMIRQLETHEDVLVMTEMLSEDEFELIHTIYGEDFRPWLDVQLEYIYRNLIVTEKPSQTQPE